jgi:hypothetical protein
VELAVSMSSASRKPEPAGTGFYLKPLSSPEPLKKIGVPSSSHSRPRISQRPNGR